ncbi:Mitogen-activated protein kinase kinase kinase YODA [Diplonema papillatum]|nr:Mitogen-activated protein kinase kinase kinase YODA [Diplonema papillatum]
MEYLVLWADAASSAASTVYLLNIDLPASPGLVVLPVDLPVDAAKSVAAWDTAICLLSGDVLWVLELTAGSIFPKASLKIAARGNAISLFSAPWAKLGALVASSSGLVIVDLVNMDAYYFVFTDSAGSVILPDAPDGDSLDWSSAIAEENGTVIRKTASSSIPFAYEYSALSVKAVPSVGLVSETSTEIVAYRGVGQPLVAVIRLDFRNEEAPNAEVAGVMRMDSPGLGSAPGEPLDMFVLDAPANSLRWIVFLNGSLIEGSGVFETLTAFAFVLSKTAAYVVAATGGISVINTTDPSSLRTTNGSLAFPDIPTDLFIWSSETPASVLWVSSLSGIYAFSLASPFSPRNLAAIPTDPVSPFICSSLALLEDDLAACITEQLVQPSEFQSSRHARSLGEAPSGTGAVVQVLQVLNISDPKNVVQTPSATALGPEPVTLVVASERVLDSAPLVSESARSLLAPELNWKPYERCAFVVQGSSVMIVNTTAIDVAGVVGEATNICGSGDITALNVLEGSLIVAACGARGVAVARARFGAGGQFLRVDVSDTFVQEDFTSVAVTTSLSEDGDVLAVAGGDSIVVALKIGFGATITKLKQLELTTKPAIGSLPKPIGQVVDLSGGGAPGEGFALSENHFVSYNLTTQPPPPTGPRETSSSGPSLAFAIPIVVVGICICLLLLAYSVRTAYKTRQLSRKDRLIDETKTIDTTASDEAADDPLSMEGTLCGGWSIVRELGKGSFGAVYLGFARERELLALKIAHVSQVSDPDGLSKEVGIMATLEHRNVIRYLGSERVLDRFVILMEFIEGGSLASFARQAELSEVVVRGYISEVCDGVAYIHSKRVLHRDIKGENILVTKDGHAKLADFGCSKMMTTEDSSGSSTFVGTPCWMAPEVITCGSTGVYTTSADIWSLGITIIELLNNGRPPWPSLPTMYAVMQHISAQHLPTVPDHVSLLCKDLLRRIFVFDASMRPTAKQLLQHPWIISKGVCDESEGNPVEQTGCSLPANTHTHTTRKPTR